MPMRKVGELVGASVGCAPFGIDVYSHPLTFPCVRHFLSFFLNYFAPVPFFQFMSVTAKKMCWWKNKFSRSYYNNKWVSINFGRYMLSKGQQGDYCEGNIYHKIEQKYPLRWFLTHFSNFLENGNSESNLTP